MHFAHPIFLLSGLKIFKLQLSYFTSAFFIAIAFNFLHQCLNYFFYVTESYHATFISLFSYLLNPHLSLACLIDGETIQSACYFVLHFKASLHGWESCQLLHLWDAAIICLPGQSSQALWQLRPDTTLNASFVLRRSSFEPHRMQDSLLCQIIVVRPKRWQSVCRGREQENDMTLIAGSKATHTEL
jgi:hypothetical protein